MSAIDAKHIFSEAQSVVLNAGAAAQATNVFELVAGEDPWGTTKYADPSVLGKMRVVVKASTALVAAVDGAVITVSVYSHTAATNIQTGTLLASKATTINTTGGAIGDLLADLMIPQNTNTKQYIGVYYSVATQNISAGAVDAYLTDHVERKSGPVQ